MTWLQRHRARHYFENSIWIVPLASMVFAMVAARLLWRLDIRMGWTSPLDAEASRSVLLSLSAAIFTLIVFVSSALLISMQLASAQLTPRIIAFIFRDRVTKYSLSLFVFSFTFAMTVAIRIESVVPLVASQVAAYSSIVSLGVFLYLIEHVGRSLRPSYAMRRIAGLGKRVIEDVYPRPLTESLGDSSDAAMALKNACECTVTSSRDGFILGFDIDGLRIMAERADCVIELAPQVGDFVAKGDPLFRLFDGGAQLPQRDLHHSVAIGAERTFEQDPTFVFRIIVDIASKALSPAINDPTTAVLGIDQIHRLLRSVGQRSLNDERVRDSAGRLRLVYRTPNWDDFVQLAVMEIRHFGGASIQVNRRLVAMLQNLIQTLPESRRSLLRQELRRLNKSAERFFTDLEDRALAGVGDPQGMGSRQDENDTLRVDKGAPDVGPHPRHGLA